MVIKFPCPYCCKNMDIQADAWERGGHVKCQFCGMKTKISPHPKSPLKEVKIIGKRKK